MSEAIPLCLTTAQKQYHVIYDSQQLNTLIWNRSYSPAAK